MVGLENMFLMFYDQPEMLHRLLARMRECVIRNLEECEAAGDIHTSASFNQCMPYARQTRSPEQDSACRLSEIWGHLAAQEFTMVSREMFEEFCLQYQMPILEKFGLVAYGCCEDLTGKIDALRRIKNLRRISVSPFADAEKCAGIIQRDYIISYRPNPATMVSFGVDEDQIRKELRRPLEAFRQNNSLFDVDLKDVQRIGGGENTLA